MTADARRADLARRIEFSLRALRPVVVGETPEANLARRAWTLLADIRAELLDDADDLYA